MLQSTSVAVAHLALPWEAQKVAYRRWGRGGEGRRRAGAGVLDVLSASIIGKLPGPKDGTGFVPVWVLSDPSTKDLVTPAGMANHGHSGPEDYLVPYSSIYIPKEQAWLLVPAPTASSWASLGWGWDWDRQLVRVKKSCGSGRKQALGPAPWSLPQLLLATCHWCVHRSWLGHGWGVLAGIVYNVSAC